MAPRNGTRLLADEFFLLAHDDVSGKPRLHSRVTGIGLASALLSELVLRGCARIRGAELIVEDRRPIDDELTNRVLAMVAARPPQPVPDWLAWLAETAADDVAARLAADGIVSRTSSWWPGRSGRWVPANMSTAAWPAARLRMLLMHEQALTVPDVMLAGLALSCGLASYLLWDTRPHSREHLDRLVSGLGQPLRDLLGQTETAVGNAVMSRRV
jgi:Golgi phosphoprotein 3 (GPP34)